MEISLENILMRGQWSWQLAWRKDYDESLFNEIKKSEPEKLGIGYPIHMVLQE